MNKKQCLKEKCADLTSAFCALVNAHKDNIDNKLLDFSFTPENPNIEDKVKLVFKVFETLVIADAITIDNNVREKIVALLDKIDELNDELDNETNCNSKKN